MNLSPPRSTLFPYTTLFRSRNERWNSSGYIRRRPLGPDEIDHQQPASDHHRRIRHVEGGPLILAGVEQEEVGHASPQNAVEKIAGRSAQHQREAPAGRRIQ